MQVSEGVWGTKGSLGSWAPVKLLFCTVNEHDARQTTWQEEEAQARMYSAPFAEGAMRLAFQAQVKFAGGTTRRFVFKAGKVSMSLDDLKADAHMQAYVI
jgi:hypothetical protein